MGTSHCPIVMHRMADPMTNMHHTSSTHHTNIYTSLYANEQAFDDSNSALSHTPLANHATRQFSCHLSNSAPLGNLTFDRYLFSWNLDANSTHVKPTLSPIQEDAATSMTLSAGTMLSLLVRMIHADSYHQLLVLLQLFSNNMKIVYHSQTGLLTTEFLVLWKSTPVQAQPMIRPIIGNIHNL